MPVSPLQPPAGRRARHTTYGSPLLDRASRVAPRLEKRGGTGLRALARRLHAGLLTLAAYWLAVPSIRVPLTGSPAGQLIRQHLQCRSQGALRFRRAQGVLFLPATYADYLRGRSRQAVRTNLRRARDQGLTVDSETIPDWGLDPMDVRAPGVTARAPLEWWSIHDAEYRTVGTAMLTVDDRTALLHLAVSDVDYGRWLLHAAIVERLCGECDLLITNTEDVPLMSPGAQHYQRLLGYSVVRLRVGPTWLELARHPLARVTALCLAAAAAIDSSHWVMAPAVSFGARSLVWVTALVAVRRASHRAGPATATALAAALGWTLSRGVSHPLVGLGYLLAGIALDVLMALVPRLTWGSVSASPAGVAMACLGLFTADLSRLAHHSGEGMAHTSFWLVPALLGAVAAGVGWWIGGLLLPWFLERPEPKSPRHRGFKALARGIPSSRGASPHADLRGRPATERTSTMLTLTPTASAAVHALLDNPELPESSGVRLQSQIDDAGRPGIGIEVVDAPVDGDQLVPAGEGHDVFLSPDVAPVLDDQVLDAELDERRVAFSLRPQSLDGHA